MTEDSAVIPPDGQQQIADTLENDAEIMSNTQIEELAISEPEDVQAEIVSINTDANDISLQVGDAGAGPRQPDWVDQLVPHDALARGRMRRGDAWERMGQAKARWFNPVAPMEARRPQCRKVLGALSTTERNRMATKDDFSPEEWEAISDGPVYAGMMIITASKGGTIRETFSMSKAWAEARQRHGESELLDAIVAEKPKLDEKPGSAIELHNAGLQMLQQAVQAIEAKSPR